MASVWTSSAWVSGRARPGGVPWLARSPFGQGLVLLVAVVAFAVLLPIVIIAIALALLGLGWAALRGWISRMRQPNGALDGRRNVRVRMHAPDSDQ